MSELINNDTLKTLTMLDDFYTMARFILADEFWSAHVEQIYLNNYGEIELVPKVGDHKIIGKVFTKEEAQRIYATAKRSGQTAALLNQERPNVFTQAVANVAPGATVKVEIQYLEPLQYEAGKYEFLFPMVVGPRYIPGAPTGQQSGGWSPDTTQVPDASRITPPVAGVHYGVKGTRAGHDISLSVKLDAGVAIKELRPASGSHRLRRSALNSYAPHRHRAMNQTLIAPRRMGLQQHLINIGVVY